jgi:hypothetical protein
LALENCVSIEGGRKMEQTLEHRIRQRAYEIWHAHGQTAGTADEHWLAAEREVLSCLSLAAPTRASEKAPKPQRRTRTKAAKTSNVAYA